MSKVWATSKCPASLRLVHNGRGAEGSNLVGRQRAVVHQDRPAATDSWRPPSQWRDWPLWPLHAPPTPHLLCSPESVRPGRGALTSSDNTKAEKGGVSLTKRRNSGLNVAMQGGGHGHLNPRTMPNPAQLSTPCEDAVHFHESHKFFTARSWSSPSPSGAIPVEPSQNAFHPHKSRNPMAMLATSSSMVSPCLERCSQRPPTSVVLLAEQPSTSLGQGSSWSPPHLVQSCKEPLSKPTSCQPR